MKVCLALVLLVGCAWAGPKNPRDCEVRELAGENINEQEVVEAKLMQFCKTAKGKEHRFCWYIGALPSSATYIIKEVSGPLSRHLPSDVACQRIKKKDAQICDLVYIKPIDLKKIDLNKEKVKGLKRILMEKWSDPCKGCAEKADFIKRIRELGKDEL